jgi:hypothetical protein
MVKDLDLGHKMYCCQKYFSLYFENDSVGWDACNTPTNVIRKTLKLCGTVTKVTHPKYGKLIGTGQAASTQSYVLGAYNGFISRQLC